MASLTATRREIEGPRDCQINARFLYRPVLDFRITLEARNPARRCSRYYRVESGIDLFGLWVVEITYGRIGTADRSQCYVLRDEGEARHLAQSVLKRFLTSSKGPVPDHATPSAHAPGSPTLAGRSERTPEAYCPRMWGSDSSGHCYGRF